MYAAPEVLKGNYNYKCDVWSLGIIMYLLLTGNEPYEYESKDDLFD